mmetsp:Transcript_17728/g.21372  ORF Transcript_17728/g.21372 Transcript_17728/m.21372 type:complete len:258 (-) Transcript_17728:748-1521(-)
MSIFVFGSKTKGINLGREMVLFCLFEMFMACPVGMAHYFVNLDQNEQTCRIIATVGMTMYLFFNLMRYRLLIAKASSFDVMKKRRRAIKIVNFVAHMGIFGFALALNVILLTSTFRIGDHKGVQVCFAANPFVPLGIASSLVAAGDTTISMICLVLNIFPVLGVWKMSAHERKIGILRNAFWAFIAMGSTFAFLVTVTVVDFTYGFIVGFVVDVGINNLTVFSLVLILSNLRTARLAHQLSSNGIMLAGINFFGDSK